MIARYALARLELSAAGRACVLAAGEQLVERHTDGAYTVLRFTASCPATVNALTVDYRLFADIDPQHRGLAKISHDGTIASAIFGTL